MKVRKTKALGAQGQRFIDAAHALGCDESEEHFDAALKKIAAQKPSEPRSEEGKRKPSKGVE